MLLPLLREFAAANGQPGVPAQPELKLRREGWPQELGCLGDGVAAERAEAQRRAQRDLAARVGLSELLISQDTGAGPRPPARMLGLSGQARLGVYIFQDRGCLGSGCGRLADACGLLMALAPVLCMACARVQLVGHSM